LARSNCATCSSRTLAKAFFCIRDFFALIRFRSSLWNAG
jgi:hypothetical protein